MIVTIDGPAASGKSTTARLVAQQIGFHHINSGLLYRAVAYLLLDNGIELEQLKEAPVDAIVTFLNPHFLIYSWDSEGRSYIAYQGEDITTHLKEPRIDRASSIISTDKVVRRCVTAYLKRLADAHDVIIDGRDTGTAVFPHADLKIFLTAQPKIRAQRWQADLLKQGITVTLPEAEHQMEERDKRDIEREIAPLKIPDEAIIIDNSDSDQEQTVAEIIALIQKVQKN